MERKNIHSGPDHIFYKSNVTPFPMLPDWARKILHIVPEIKAGVAKGMALAFLYETIRFIPIIIIKLLVDYFVTSQSTTVKLVYFII